MRIAVDMLGGDHAPHELVAGIAQALLSGDFTADELLLVGPQDIIAAQFAELGVSDVPEILHTTDVIAGLALPERLKGRKKCLSHCAAEGVNYSQRTMKRHNQNGRKWWRSSLPCQYRHWCR